MAQKLSAKAQQKIDVLEEGRRKMDRIYGLVEQLALARAGAQGSLCQMMARASTNVSRLFLVNGLGPIADTANQIVLKARGRGDVNTKVRYLRELVGSIRSDMERMEKGIRAEGVEPHEEA